MEKTLLLVKWPEIDREVLVEPIEANQMLFNWFIEKNQS